MRYMMWLWSGTLTWLLILPSVIPENSVWAIGPEARALGALAAILVVLPPLRRRDVRWALLLLPLWLLVSLWNGMPDDATPVTELAGLAYLGGAIVLANRLGRKMDGFEAALDELAAGPEAERADSFEKGQREIYREIRRARRYQRPATLMALSASGADTPRLLREVEQEVSQKYADAQMARLLIHETDAAAVVTRRNGHFVVLLPETGGEAAHQLARRLANTASERWGMELRCGTATFPDEEVTFGGLLERAEGDLRMFQRERVPVTLTATETVAEAVGIPEHHHEMVSSTKLDG